MMSMERDQSKLDVPTLFLSGQWMAPPFAIYELTQNEKVQDWCVVSVVLPFPSFRYGPPIGPWRER